MLAKSPEMRKNTYNIENDYTEYSEIEFDQAQYIVANIEFE